MVKEYNTPQESFWASQFGDEYIRRNKSLNIQINNIAFFARILSKLNIKINSLIEFGPNIGLNLLAIKQLLPQCEMTAVEINEIAVEELKAIKELTVYHNSIFEFQVDYQRDLVLTKGLLIHINPDLLNQAYEILYNTSKCYICISEYYNPTPVEVVYRGHNDRLFKRDFAGELLDKYIDLRLVDYGFVYHRDNNFPQDDMSWFILEKVSQKKF